MKIAGLIVLYNPEVDIVIKHIDSYKSEIEKLFIVDNSESGSNNFDLIVKDLNIDYQYLVNNRNLGIAKALNQGIELAINEGYDWILTMDQDSYFTDNLFFKVFSEFTDKENVAIFSQNYTSYPIEVTQDNKFKEVFSDKMSGNLLNLSIYKEIGGFQEDLFIDKVDVEYCLRAKRSDYKIILFENIYLIHQFGRPYKTTSIFSGKEFYRFDHLPLRYYYSTRNLLIVSKKYIIRFPKLILSELLYFPRHLYGIFVYEKEKRKKLCYVLYGILHFFLGIRGNLNKK